MESIKSFIKNSNYLSKDFKKDLFAGIIVAFIAIPLSLSLAISAGVAPVVGLYTIITAGLITAILGGSKFQVTGPTAAFVAILLPIVNTYGYQGLILTTFIAGLFLITMGYLQFGKIIQYIPYPVTTGFTSGIGVVIMSLQMKDFFGLTISHSPSSFIERASLIANSFPSCLLAETLVGVGTLAALVLCRRYKTNIPSPIIVLPVISIVCFLSMNFLPDLHISTIMTTFSSTINNNVVSGIPNALPSFICPWNYLASENLNFSTLIIGLKPFIIPAIAIAILASIESLLSAVVADGITNTKHDSNAELIGLGWGNVVGSFFGSIPATGAIARTATNIQFGAKTKLSAIIHTITVLIIMLFAAKIISHIPMASLAALLVMVSFDMLDIKKVKKIILHGPKSDAFVLLTTLMLTVLFDMVTGIIAGIIFAALLFMKRMTDITCGCIVSMDNSSEGCEAKPDNVICYKINGPLFFGAADKAVKLINNFMEDKDTIIFKMDSVPVIDLTGLTALEASINNLQEKNKTIIFTGLQPQPYAMLNKLGFLQEHCTIMTFETAKEALLYLNNTSNNLSNKEIYSKLQM